ncbi:ABC transporter permease [Geofilum rhodophaeum]|uniref:ABC transporter permease n=1 Tax=Geofilum rhodophaeum TaxID=1965019 RepID=UPI000B51EB10|nr:ABC transporter permease [Geofilum rhodophaeum]
MFDQDRWQEIFSAIKQNKLRSALTAFGVFWGIFMLITMTGAGNGLVNGVTAGFKHFATNSAFVWTSNTTKPYKGFRQGRPWNFNNEDMATIRREVPGVDLLAPKLQGWNLNQGENVIRGLRTGAFNIVGEVPDFNRIDPNEMIYGRFINEMDVEQKRKVCVIGERVYEVLFDKDENPVGEYIRVSGVWFQVIGVARSLNPNVQIGGDKKELVSLPFSTMQQSFNYGNEVHFFGFTTKSGYSVSETADAVTRLLKVKHSVDPDDLEATGNFNVEEMAKTMNNMFLGINLLIWIVGIGTLVAGAVGVSNIMLVTVRERTKEIGIQRAIGARPWTIISQILTESVFLTTLAGFLGLALGTLILSAVSTGLKAAAATSEEPIFFQDLNIGLATALLALGVLVLTGFFAGLIPARKAVRVKPIEALRHE